MSIPGAKEEPHFAIPIQSFRLRVLLGQEKFAQLPSGTQGPLGLAGSGSARAMFVEGLGSRSQICVS